MENRESMLCLVPSVEVPSGADSLYLILGSSGGIGEENVLKTCSHYHVLPLELRYNERKLNRFMIIFLSITYHILLNFHASYSP